MPSTAAAFTLRPRDSSTDGSGVEDAAKKGWGVGRVQEGPRGVGDNEGPRGVGGKEGPRGVGGKEGPGKWDEEGES